MKQTATEKYIKKAVEEASKKISGTEISNCTVTMNMQADGATQTLAEAMLAQAEANEQNSQAMLKLAESLKPIDVCAIKVVQDKIESPL